MPLTPIEIIAAVFAILGVIKLLVIMVDKKKWLPVVNIVYGNQFISGIVMLVLAAVVFYYLFLDMTIVQIFSVAALISLLMGISFVSYGKDFTNFAKKMINKRFSGWMWLSILIWLALMLWVLYEIFL